MGLAAAKQYFEQMICKNKVQPIKTNQDGIEAEANAMGLEVDENGIPVPVKRMAWNMIPKNSKLSSMLELCQRPPPEQALSPQPPSTLLQSALPKVDTSIVTVDLKPQAEEVIKTGENSISNAGAEVQRKISDAAASVTAETSEIIEELDPQMLVQRAGPPSSILTQLPDAISDVSSIVDK